MEAGQGSAPASSFGRIGKEALKTLALLDTVNLGAANHAYTGPFHLQNRRLDVPRLEIDAPARILDQRHVETKRAGIQRRELHAIIGRQSHHVDFLHLSFLPPVSQSL